MSAGPHSRCTTKCPSKRPQHPRRQGVSEEDLLPDEAIHEAREALEAQVRRHAEAPRDANSDDWGAMREKEREKAVQFLRERFPTRYRELIERYYRALAEQDQ